jgi:hypothetical protein
MAMLFKPLHREKNEAIVHLLLEKGAEVNAQGYYGNALQGAATGENEVTAA